MGPILLCRQARAQLFPAIKRSLNLFVGVVELGQAVFLFYRNGTLRSSYIILQDTVRNENAGPLFKNY